MKAFWMALGLALVVGLWGCVSCNPVGAQELNVSWGGIKVQMAEEPAEKLVVTKNKVGGTKEPPLEITNVTPEHLLSAGNGVVVEMYELQARRNSVAIRSLPVEISLGLTNVGLYISYEGMQIGPMILDPGTQEFTLGNTLVVAKLTKVQIEFRAQIPESGNSVLRVDLLSGHNNAVELESGRMISTPAVHGTGGRVVLPRTECTGFAFSPIDGTPCSQEVFTK